MSARRASHNKTKAYVSVHHQARCAGGKGLRAGLQKKGASLWEERKLSSELSATVFSKDTFMLGTANLLPGISQDH